MALNGIALGGASEGILGAQNQILNQQRADQSYELGQKGLALQQQAMQNAEHRALLARADKSRGELMSLASETIQQLQLAGKDPATIARAVQPIVQQAKRLAQSSGADPAMIDAQISVALARPSNPSMPGSDAGAPAAAAPAPAAPAPSIGGQPALRPTTNLTDPNTTITGIDYGPVQNLDRNGRVVSESPAPQLAENAPAATPAPAQAPAQPDPQAEVDKWTNYIARLRPDTPAATREVAMARLKDAMRVASGGDVEVKVLKTEDGNDVPVFINKATRQITTMNGQPFAMPGTGDQKTDSEVISENIINGKQPPVLTGLYKNSKGVRAALGRKDFDLSNAQLEWKAAEKQIQSLNGPQMTRYAGLAHSVVNTIDEVKELSNQLQLSGIPLLNAAQLQTYVQTQGNSPQGQLVTRYLAAVGTLKEEFANLANGGYAPTEPAWALANQQVNGNYGVKQLDASLTEIQRLIRYRLNAIPNFSKLGPNGNNRYTGSQAAPAPAEGAPSSGGWSVQRIQ